MRGHRKIDIRLARLLLDSVLDVVYSIGIPLVIFYPYYRDYIDSFNVYPFIFYYMDTWYVNALSELRQVFVTSWPDLISKSTGSIALLYRLYIVENVLKDAQDPQFVPRRETNAYGEPKEHATIIRRLASAVRSRLTKILDAVLLLWGFTVLTLHIYSTIVAIRDNSAGCLLETRPWGSSEYSCTVLEVNCKARHITGAYPTTIDALDNVDPLRLQVLILSHCTELQVPSTIQAFSALSMVKVYNSTLQSWDASAAISEATNPSLQVMYFTRVTMSGIPSGLLAPDFPSQLWDLEFCITNLSTFPDAVVESWQNVVYLAIEASPFLLEMPDVVFQLPSVQFFMLGMNSIQSLPDWAFAARDLIWLFADGNPLSSLPAEIKTLEQLRYVSLRNTNMSSLPATWLSETPPLDYRIPVAAVGTPLCARSTANETRVGPFDVNCSKSEYPLITFPIDAEDTWRAASTSNES